MFVENCKADVVRLLVLRAKGGADIAGAFMVSDEINKAAVRLREIARINPDKTSTGDVADQLMDVISKLQRLAAELHEDDEATATLYKEIEG